MNLSLPLPPPHQTKKIGPGRPIAENTALADETFFKLSSPGMALFLTKEGSTDETFRHLFVKRLNLMGKKHKNESGEDRTFILRIVNDKTKVYRIE